jgi:hypothetical protein
MLEPYTNNNNIKIMLVSGENLNTNFQIQIYDLKSQNMP